MMRVHWAFNKIIAHSFDREELLRALSTAVLLHKAENVREIAAHHYLTLIFGYFALQKKYAVYDLRVFLLFHHACHAPVDHNAQAISTG